MNFEKSHFERLQDWIQEGSKEQLTAEEVDYLNSLQMMHGIFLKYGRKNAMNFMMTHYHLSRRVAGRMFSEMLNLFYADDEVKNRAYRNLIFNLQMEMHLAAKKTATTMDEIEIASKILERAAKVKKLEEPDEQTNDESAKKSIKVYTLEPQLVGIPKINRDELARQIDEMQLNEEDKVRIKTDAGLEEANLSQMIDDTKKRTEEYE